MSILRFSAVTREVGTFVILDAIEASIALGDRIGLVGPNGAGKSVLAPEELRPVKLTAAFPGRRASVQVMSQELYRSAPRVFWVVDNRSSHRGATEPRLRERWPQIRVVHTQIHVSWLNQVELYYCVVQRKVLEPNQWRSLAEIEAALHAFADHYSAIAAPFEWRFTRLGLHRVLAALTPKGPGSLRSYDARLGN